MERLVTLLAALLLSAVPTAATAATFDLRAAATTVSLPGLAEPIAAWGFADETGLAPGSGTVSTPGPVLRLPAGESLTVHLTNDLPVPVSFVVPGQPHTPPPAPINEGGRVRSFAVEVAPATSGTYTFAALAEGTFLYQSGTNVGVQLPMGLFGALVVGAAPAGMADRVLVWSELDPAVNAAVAAAPTSPYATARFKAARYLINGRAYPDQAALELTAGTDTYLRVLNAGAALHMPAFSGFPVTVVRQDGESLAHPFVADVLRLTPGMVIEAIARPASPGRYVLSDRRLHSGGAGGATMVVDATGANLAPAVSAGPDLRALASVGAIALQGAASDGDGPAALATTWRQISGPAPVAFADAASPTTGVSFTLEGQYVLELAGSDGMTTVADRMTLTVAPVTPPSDPADVLVVRVRAASLYLTWRDSSTSATSFVIERREAVDGVARPWTEIATRQAPVAELLDNDAAMGAANHEWQYRVRATNEVGSSAAVESAWIQ